MKHANVESIVKIVSLAVTAITLILSITYSSLKSDPVFDRLKVCGTNWSDEVKIECFAAIGRIVNMDAQ